MSIRNLDKLFNPASVAVIGANPVTDTVGGVLARNITRAGFRGPIMLVDPDHATIGDLAVYSDIAHLPQTPDLAVIAAPPALVPGILAELGARGTRAAVVASLDGAQPGNGDDVQRRMLEAARPYLMRVIGPGSVGVMVPGSGLDASFAHIAPPKGDLAFVSQSGALVTAVLDWAQARGIGFSHVVSLGATADVDFGDMLDFLAADNGTRAILLYVERVTHARKFMSAARAAARAKPVLAVKVGRFAESAGAIRSHTGALAGADAVYDAAFRRAGMLRVHTMAELFDAVETLAQTRPQNGDGLAILTNDSGAGVLATDALIAAGGRLARLSATTIARLDAVLPRSWSGGNPVDIIGDADGARYARALEILLSDLGIDAVLVLNCPTALASAVDAAQAVIATLEQAGALPLAGRNVLTAWLGDGTASQARRLFAAAHIATYDTPDSAVNGFMHRVHYRRNRELLMETPPARPEGKGPDAARAAAVIARACAAGRSWLDPAEVADVLDAYGIPAPACRIVKDATAAAQAAAEIGAPVALKIRSPDITHKDDVGGVALNLGNPGRVAREGEAMLARVAAAAPKARLEGLLVQQMVNRPGAVELILGVVEDAVFGPVVLFGQGGTLVELMDDTTLELPPLNQALARAQMVRTRVFRLLQGYRGAAAADLDAVTAALIAVAQLAAEQPALKELDINPLLADCHGVIAVDARIRIGAATQPATARLAIRPYPKELESRGTLSDGTALLLRPIRPEDEPLIQDIVRHMDPADLRLRFFTPVRIPLSHQFAARLSQLDYDREMALIALTEQDGTALGAARFAGDPDGAHAEFAIGLRSDWQGRGLGALLMRRIIDVATARGIGELSGDVLRENDSMLQLCHALGFSVAPHPDDPTVVRVRRKLR
jgi:acetyltransferase